MTESPAMGAQNGFEKLAERPQKRTIRQRWALKMVSTSYPNDHPDAPFLSDGCSKWIRKLTQTIAKMNHSPAMGAQNGFDKLPKRCQRCPIPQRWALKMVSKYRRNEPFPSDGRSEWIRGPGPQPRFTPVHLKNCICSKWTRMVHNHLANHLGVGRF